MTSVQLCINSQEPLELHNSLLTTVYKMKTSLLILCASLAMAASTTLEEFQAKDESVSLVIVCEKPVKLFVLFAEDSQKGIRSAFIQEHKLCQTHHFDSFPAGVNVGNRISDGNVHAEALTCQWFSVTIPAFNSPHSSSVECLDF